MKALRFRSKRVQQIPSYMFAVLNQKKKRLMERGVDIIDLGIGDSDLSTPKHVVEKMHDEINAPVKVMLTPVNFQRYRKQQPSL